MSRLARVTALALALVLGPSPTPARATGEPDWAEARREAAALLSRLVRIDTTNPPGNELPAARLLERYFRSEGIAARTYEPSPRRGNVLARLPVQGGEPAGGALLLLSHLDVVPAAPDSWSFPPFSGAIADGFVYGRGALDDKGQAVIFAVALALLERSGTERRRELVFLSTADEETGGPFGVQWMIEHQWEALGPPVAVWNEGGASARVPLLGGAVLNGIATTEKRALWLRVVSEGEGGHGSQPDRNAANERLVRALARIADHETRVRLTPTVRETFRRASTAAPFPMDLAYRFAGSPLLRPFVGGQLAESRITNAMVRDTIAITGLRSGLKHNLIPRRAEALVDVRLLPDSDVDAFLEELTRVIDDPEIRVELTPDLELDIVPASPWDHELFQAIEAELDRELPGSVTAPLQTPGSSDSLFFRKRGVPAYGYLPAVLPDELNRSIHGLDERIPLDELERALRVTYHVLERLVQ